MLGCDQSIEIIDDTALKYGGLTKGVISDESEMFQLFYNIRMNAERGIL